MTQAPLASSERVFAVVTGGGTSGHVVPAIAVIEALEDSGHDSGSLAFVGCRRGVDRSLMEDSGVAERVMRCAYLNTSGLQRGFSPRSLVRNLALPWRVLTARRAARALIRQWRPKVVVSVGGYASDPMADAAIGAGVPLVCVSYDKVPGLATRLQAKRADACAVAFIDSDLPRARHTGAPVRRVFRSSSRAEPAVARGRLGLPAGEPVVTVVGGSLGSGALNSATGAILATLGRRSGPITVLHLCGQRFIDADAPTAPPSVTYVRRPLERDMAAVYAATDVLVSRAGASTVAEIAATGTAAILVPWSGAADDHQRLNAEWLGRGEAAIVIAETSASDVGSLGSTIAAEVTSLLDDDERRSKLAANAFRLGEPSRGDALIRLLEECAR